MAWRPPPTPRCSRSSRRAGCGRAISSPARSGSTRSRPRWPPWGRAARRASPSSAPRATDRGAHRARLGPRLEGLGRRVDARELGRQAVEVALEPRRRADDERACLGAAEVGEGVRRAPGRERELPRARRPHLLAGLEGQLALQHVEALVEPGMDVERRAGEVGRDDLVDHRQPAPALLAAQEDADGGAHDERSPSRSTAAGSATRTSAASAATPAPPNRVACTAPATGWPAAAKTAPRAAAPAAPPKARKNDVVEVATPIRARSTPFWTATTRSCEVSPKPVPKTT